MSGHPSSPSQQAQVFWLRWVEAAFPDLDSRAYFLPPVYFNRVPMTRQSVARQKVLVLREASGKTGPSVPKVSSSVAQASATQLPIVHDCQVRDDTAMERVLFCLQEMSEKNKEVLVGLSQLQFGQYLGEPCYAAAAAQLPLSSNLPPALPRNWKQGDFDVLLIHRRYGIIVCEGKAIGDIVETLKMSQKDIDNHVRKKLEMAISQLDKAEAMLLHLVSDVTPGLRVTKTMALPNLTARQVQQAISGDSKLTQELCRCLVTTDPVDITGLCLCSDQLSDPKTPWDVSSDVLRELGNWWKRRVAVSGPDSHMTDDMYKTLVARFCGPATTVTVSCTSPPRLCVKTLGQAVSLTGEFYTAQITLFPEQVDLINTAPPRLFVSGPAGTGKTVVLLLMGVKWLRRGKDVHIVCTWDGSLAVCCMLYHLMRDTVGRPTAERQLHLHVFDFYDDTSVEKAVKDLSSAAIKGSLYVIADEAIADVSHNFQTFSDKLLSQVPRLHLWASGCYHGHAPAGWHVEYLTRPLRCPPAVVREVTFRRESVVSNPNPVKEYSERAVPDHSDGPPVVAVYHRFRGHETDSAQDCVTCVDHVASFLNKMHADGGANTDTPSAAASASSHTASPPGLQWRDMMVLTWTAGVREDSVLVRRLTEANVPLQLLTNEAVRDVATARSDKVCVMNGEFARSLERKVVVVFLATSVIGRMCSSENDIRVNWMSRCTSQLMIVYPTDTPIDLSKLKTESATKGN